MFNFGFLSRMKSISRIRQSSFPLHFFKTENYFGRSGFEISWHPFTCAPPAVALFFNSLMEMTSSVADIICIAQITFKLIYNTLPADDRWFPFLNSKLLANYIVCFGLPMLLRRSLSCFRTKSLDL